MSGRSASVRLARRLQLDRPINAVAGSLIGVTTDHPVFHLTFDDGPHPDLTPRVLDVLDEHGATATFFVLTARAQEHRDVLAEIIRRGHEIALHTRTHPRLTDLTWGRLVDEIKHARSDLEDVAGRTIDLFRPPYGASEHQVSRSCSNLGDADRVVVGRLERLEGIGARSPLERASGGLQPGGILLLHDVPVGDNESDDRTRGFVPKDELHPYLDLVELAERGLEAVSLQRLLAAGSERRKVKL